MDGLPLERQTDTEVVPLGSLSAGYIKAATSRTEKWQLEAPKASEPV